jgi:hypothetical protein
MRMSLRKVNGLGIYRSYLKPAAVILLRRSAFLEVSIRNLRIGDNLDIREDILLLISENLKGSLYRYGELIN